MYVLGISGFETRTHRLNSFDASAAIICDGRIVYAASEERFSRTKHHSGFPINAINACLRFAKIDIRDVTAISYPYGFSREGPLRDGFYPTKFEQVKQIAVDHQKSHASCARLSPFRTAVVISLDAAGYDKGRFTSGGVYVLKRGELELFHQFPRSASLGLFYSAFTDALGYRMNDGEGTVMSLSSYGNPESCYSEVESLAPKFRGMALIRSHDFEMISNLLHHNLRVQFREKFKIQRLISRYGRENVAAALQEVLEERVTELVQTAMDLTGIKQVVLSGGVFYNILVNMAIREKVTRDVWSFPVAGDAGTTIGSALQAYSELVGTRNNGPLTDLRLGDCYDEYEIMSCVRKSNLTFSRVDPATTAVDLIERKKVIGWFRGRAEFGHDSDAGMRPGSSLQPRKEFDAKFSEVCESTIRETLGESGMKSVAWWLCQSGVSMKDSSLRPQEFDDALVDLFHPMGALVIEAKILARFYRALGTSYHPADSLNFGDEVRKAKRLFEGSEVSG